MGCSNQTVGGTVTVFLSSWGTWKSPETRMCLWSEEGEHGEEEREAAAGLVTAAEEDRWDGSKRRAAVRGSEEPAAPRQAVLAGRQSPLSLLGCSPDLCPRGLRPFQFALTGSSASWTPLSWRLWR